MDKPKPQFMLSVNVQIQNVAFPSCAVGIRDEVPTRPLTFREMAEVLEAFHVLLEKYRA